MSSRYQELDFRSTPLGDLMLRRRRMVRLGDLDIYEVKLGEYFLMSSLFHEAEAQLAKLALGGLQGDRLDVVVGGLGLGYTAASALEDARVSSLIVVEYLAGVIEWHQRHLVPLGATLTADPRCQLVQADFFALARDLTTGFDSQHPTKKYHAVLLDIDHTPTNVLHPENARFYTVEGLRELAQHLQPAGVFALWVDGEPDAEFTARLSNVFATVRAHTVDFDNPVLGGAARAAVYVAQSPMSRPPAS